MGRQPLLSLLLVAMVVGRGVAEWDSIVVGVANDTLISLGSFGFQVGIGPSASLLGVVCTKFDV